MGKIELRTENPSQGEIVIYQPDEVTRLEVKVEGETVWLTQDQIAILFGVKRPAITKHIRNIFLSEELEESSVCSILERTAADDKIYMTRFYNLDMILSVGYRVNSKNAIHFRRWASVVLKEYMLKGFAINQRLHQIEDRFDRRMTVYERLLDEHEKKIDFFIRTSLPPVEGVFYDGQIFETFVKPLVSNNNNGAGCTFASAIASNLAISTPMVAAIEQSKAFTYQAILSSNEYGVFQHDIND